MGCLNSTEKSVPVKHTQRASYQNPIPRDEMAKIHEQRAKNTNKHAERIHKYYQQKEEIERQSRENQKHNKRVYDWLN